MKKVSRIFSEMPSSCSWESVRSKTIPLLREVKTNERSKERRFAVDTGYLPIAPHLLFPQFMDDGNPKERELAMFFGNVLMSKCAELWVCGDTVSSGMAAEIERAKRKNYAIRYFNSDLKEVTENA